MSAKLRKSVSAKPSYRSASLPAKMIQLYLETLPVPAGGIQKLSWGMLLEELSIPLPWLRVALREISDSGVLPLSGLFTFLPKGLDRVNNPNMVKSAVRRIDRLDAQSGPIPAPVWEQAIAHARTLLEEKPYLREYLDFCVERRQSAPESVEDWDAGLDWQDRDRWAPLFAGNPAATGLDQEQIVAIVESVLRATFPALIEPLLTTLRQMAPSIAAACPVPPGSTREATESAPPTRVDAPAQDAATAPTPKQGGQQGILFFPVTKDSKGDQMPLSASFIDNLSARFPDLDIPQEIRAMVRYLKTHTRKIPARSKAAQYISKWMNRKDEQNRGIRSMDDKPDETVRKVTQTDTTSRTPFGVKPAVAKPVEVTQPPLQNAPEEPVPAMAPETAAEDATVKASTRPEDGSDLDFLFFGDDPQERNEADLPPEDLLAEEAEKTEEGADAGETVEAQEVQEASGYRAKPRATVKTDEMTPGFIRFWEAYPRREARKTALQSWHRNGCEEQIEAILQDVEWKKKHQWKEVKYIPMPTTYLNQERWTDEKSDVKRIGAKRADEVTKEEMDAILEKERQREIEREARLEKLREEYGPQFGRKPQEYGPFVQANIIDVTPPRQGGGMVEPPLVMLGHHHLS
ncbi:hypothetical protein AB4090_05185 [Acidithiobacillus sp. IBUN Pt1247-S3]|uniref:hypothetical protein n=1 Tax=Acidithiobacillus sp. IBUN Pt1247-S3 TaxID=3166642 RepID=UPI0034E576B1